MWNEALTHANDTDLIKRSNAAADEQMLGHDLGINIESYRRQGFTLMRLSSGAITDWNAANQLDSYKQEMESIARRLHPKTKRIRWTGFLKRVGRQSGGYGNGVGINGPAVNVPHLDYYQVCRTILSLRLSLFLSFFLSFSLSLYIYICIPLHLPSSFLSYSMYSYL